jgi:hypothetical protein
MQLKIAARHYTGTVPSPNTAAYAAVDERITDDLNH